MSIDRAAFSGALRRAVALAVVAALGAGTVPARRADQASEQTIKNLQTALNGERNAHVRYLAFAQKADEENYGAVASLFRAAAASEEIHGNNHEAVLQKVGAAPEVKIETAVVQSTAKNLETAIAGESYEWQTMYPEFTRQARQDRYVPAIVTLQRAYATEEEHAKFFREALQKLDELKGSTARTYYVCMVCGFTTANLNFERCPNCLEPKDRYKAIS
jgi:rubrerythrin